MKTSGKIAIAAAAVGAWLIARKNKSVSGIGEIRRISSSVLNKAKKLFDAYDEACEIEREQDAKCDAIYESFEARGLDPFADENERIVIDALYQAGLTDENGMTDVAMNRHNARKELFDFINANIVTLFPIPASDRKLLSNTRNIIYQNRLLDATRNFVNKTLEHNRNIREILNSGILSGIGRVQQLDYDDYVVSTKDGKHAVEFQWMSDGDVSVNAWYKGDGSNPQFDWDFWNHVGFYKTLSGAKRGAKKFMLERGHELKDADLNKIK